MRLRHIPGAEETIASSPYVIQEPALHKGSWNQVFGNDHPIEIEVGMGKGRFIKSPYQLHWNRTVFQRTSERPAEKSRTGTG